MAKDMDSIKRHSAERAMFVRYAEKERDILQIQILLNLPLDAGEALYKKMQDEVQSWAEITPYSFTSIWEPARERYRTMMCFGVWNYETWKKAVADIITGYQLKTWIGWDLPHWETIEEIEF